MGDRVDDRADIVGRDEALEACLARLQINLNLSDLRAHIAHVLGLRKIRMNSDSHATAGLGDNPPQADLLAGILSEPKFAATEVHLFGRALQQASSLDHELLL